MKVAITNRNDHEWSAVCSQFGVEYEPVREVVNVGMDGEEGTCVRYYLVNDEHMATWIRLIKPRWIHE